MKFKLKKVVIIGTMALVISINPNFYGYLTSLAYAGGPSRQSSLSNAAERPDEELNALLGKASDKEVYDALLEGQSLAEMAESSGQNANRIVRLQVQQLQEQLLQRLNDGHLSREAYERQLQELPDIVAASVENRYTIIG
ncbi:hypothetical protein [Paenibacillus macerans]|uniref:hypothetical protein n=1 Tax=Paenibacillus macerans TaxID=44252 RepID=UPI003D31D37A